MTENQTNDTLEEILAEDREGFRKRRKFGGLIVRLLILAVLIFVGLYAFILFRQYRLNLEARAVIFARQTVQAADNNSQPGQEDAAGDVENAVEATLTPPADEASNDDSLPTPSLAQ